MVGGVEGDDGVVVNLLARQDGAEAVPGRQDPALVDQAPAAGSPPVRMVDLWPML